jgi:uncharacterized Zn finger protein
MAARGAGAGPSGSSGQAVALGAASARTAWSRRFLALIEELGMTGAVRDGRRLVRAGAVTSVRRAGNLVVAMVRDADDAVYVDAAHGDSVHKARLAFGTFSGGQWARVERALAARAGFAASLLAGAVPPEIDRVFAALGLSPLPTGADDLAMDCSCRDWRRPCAHLAAACHALAEHLDRDPFEVLALRGRERDVLLDGLRTYRGVPVPAPGPVPDGSTLVDGRPDRNPDGGASPSSAAGPDRTPAPPTDTIAFWSSPTRLPGATGSETPDTGGAQDEDTRPDAILDRCGPLIVDASGDLRDALRPVYGAFTRVPRGAHPNGRHP